jgi:disulfide bond formation protein DsbB
MTLSLALVLVLSVIAISSAWVLEIWGELPPCPLCLTQRVAYYAAIPLAALALFLPARVGDRAGWRHIALAAAVFAIAVGGGYGVFHLGVENQWWAPPPGCTAAELPQTIAELQALLDTEVPPPPCDEVPWSLFGISLAGMNVLASLAIIFVGAWGLIAGDREE